MFGFRSSRPETLFAVRLTVLAALAVTILAAGSELAVDTYVLSGKFGMPVMTALGAEIQAYRAIAVVFLLLTIIFWSLASWRLPILISVLGLAILIMAAVLAEFLIFHERWTAVLGSAVFGVTANLFLRLEYWARSK